MLAFVTSLRHPRNAQDYARVEELLQETLHSVTRQTCQDFVVIVVGNRVPSFPLPEQVHFVRVRYPAPARRSERVRWAALVRDKGTKIGIGLIAAREFSPDHVMIFDADDFVHRDLAAFVAQHPGQDGWVIEDGWVYSRARSAYRSQPGFNRTCGTSFIVAFEAYGVPSDLDVRATRAQVRAAYGERIFKIIGAHKWARQWYAEHGWNLQPLPFRGAVYHVDTGENHSGNALAGRARPLDATMTADFGIRPTRGRLGTLWACYGSGPARQVRAALGSLGGFSTRVARALRRRASNVLRASAAGPGSP